MVYKLQRGVSFRWPAALIGGRRDIISGELVVLIGGPGAAAGLMLFWDEMPERWEAVKFKNVGSWHIGWVSC
jgi:hypothetical protein